MGGGLMQLVAYGAQDIYLTGNPQITFFKVVYRRHTNFSMESIEQTLSGTVGFGNKVTATISRNGDLISRMYVESSIAIGGHQDSFANVGSALLSEIELEIGGQRIDKHYGHWLETWAELTQNNVGHRAGTSAAAAAGGRTKGTVFQNMSCMGGVSGQAATIENVEKMFIPLQFFFCRNPGLALPLIALQYHEVKVAITFGTLANVIGGGSPTLSASLYVDYVYLDTDERRRFAQQSHEYLIEQLQFENHASAKTMELNFNHPVKELVWIGTPTATATTTAGPSTPTTVATGSTYQLKLNGHDRFSARDYRYFSRQQVHDYHSGVGGIALTQNDAENTAADTIGVYSFALKPEEHQPSGTCNFSRIDNARLVLGAAQGLHVYAVNYNVLRIMSGMGGLAYSN
jgi:hypothetical protein